MSTPPSDYLPPRPPPQDRAGCYTALAIIAGLVMLLPGACAIIFGGGLGIFSDPAAIALLLICLAISAGGIALIRWALRRPP